jgi:phosphoglycerate dehydrogenase-like enzyme
MRILVSIERDDQSGAPLLSALEGVRVVPYDPNARQLTDEQCAAEILVPPYRGTPRALKLLPQMPNLRMVQLLSAGTDEWSSEVPAGVTLASSRGAHAGPVSEWILSAILAQLRQWPALVRFQDKGIWAHRKFDADTLAGKRVLILGAGSIGMAASRLLAAFSATSTLVASTARGDIHGTDEIPYLIAGHDIVVITAPINESTNGLVGREFLAAMDDGALLVNAGRGQIVDTDALADELRTGRLRAALDVTEPEPLPPGHPLFTSPGVILSPHSARTVPGTNKLCYEVSSQQIRTFLDGGVPSNVAK